MRLPADAALILLAEGDPASAALAAAWRAQDLPVFVADGDLDARLDEQGVTTLVVCGDEAGFVERAISGGYRVFVVAETLAADGAAKWQGGEARLASLRETVIAAAGAKARQKLRAARADD